MVPKLFGPIRERYLTRPGGYTRVLRIEPLKEDQAESAILELVDGPRDMRFAMTAKTLARLPPTKLLNDLTAKNVKRVTQFREGGMSELQEMVQEMRIQKEEGIDDLAPLFGMVRKAYLIGESTEAFARVLDGKLDHSKCRTIDLAVQQAFEDARASGIEGAIVLFSPACASFDQFRDFEQRGLAFRQEAAKLVKRRTPTEPA